MSWWMAYIGLGLFTGFSAGMLGIGGGLVMVPTLTTLRPDYVGMANNAIDCLQSRLADPSLPSRESIYAPELIVRESSAPPAQ